MKRLLGSNLTNNYIIFLHLELLFDFQKQWEDLGMMLVNSQKIKLQ
jgi:hypothetical protein